MTHSQTLINALSNPTLYDHPVSKLEVIETHISWVILTGSYVYKIKKPLKLGFLDFSTLPLRKKYCEIELRLNRRLAPDYYLSVIPITGSENNPSFSGKSDAIEYALKMAQFPQENELDRELDSGNLNQHSMHLIAEKIADFHNKIGIANNTQRFGEPDSIYQSVLNCYTEIFKHITKKTDIQRVEKLREWSSSTFTSLKDTFITRKKNGFIRECHGDLHLRNIAIVNDEVIAFDCIEFNEDLRWNDLMSEIAFLVMDLDDHQRPDLASAFLNRYLELTGDYGGLKALHYYLIYRAIVRAMVCCIRLSQDDISTDEKEKEYKEFLRYIALSETYTQNQKPILYITHGLSGSGKTTASQKLLLAHSVIRVRSDIERKRMNDINEKQRKREGVGQGIYSPSASNETYEKLHQLATKIIDAGFTVIVDATFLKIKQRGKFQQLAEIKNIPYRILNCAASPATMKERIINREKLNTDASDANIAVLESQMTQDEKFTAGEIECIISVNTEGKPPLQSI